MINQIEKALFANIFEHSLFQLYYQLCKNERTWSWKCELFQLKVFGRKIKENTLAMCFKKTTARPIMFRSEQTTYLQANPSNIDTGKIGEGNGFRNLQLVSTFAKMIFNWFISKISYSRKKVKYWSENRLKAGTLWCKGFIEPSFHPS